MNDAPNAEQGSKPAKLNLDNRFTIHLDRHSEKGGMGRVYKATDERLHIPLVAKTFTKDFLTQRPDALQLLESEAKTTANLQHPNLPKVYDLAYDDNGKPYFLMEDLKEEGYETLDIYGYKNLNKEEIITIMSELSDVVTFLHSQKIPVRHRDLKLANIFYKPDAENGIHVVLADFGASSGVFPVDTEQRLGTLEYMSPEVLRQEKMNEQSDVYSMSLVLQKLLSGRSLHTDVTDADLTMLAQGYNSFTLMEFRNNKIYDKLRAWNSNIELFVKEINKSMKSDPNERHATVREFTKNIIQTLQSTVPETNVPQASEPPSTPDKARGRLWRFFKG